MLTKKLIDQAEMQNKAYSQYKGHWKNWKAGQIVSTVKLRKSGIAFVKGDQVLFDPESVRTVIQPTGPAKEVITAYSFRNQIDTSISIKSITRGR